MTMPRRDFLTCAAALPAGWMAGGSRLGLDRAVAAEVDAPPPLSDAEAFNYVVGTQSIGATYQFTQDTVLVETARAILGLGSNVLKFTMGRGFERMMLRPSKAAYPETMQYLLNQGSDARQTPRIQFPGAAIQAPPSDPAIQSLTDLAQRDPSCREVFRMPFAYYLIWTYAFTPRWWNRGFAAEDREKEYREMRAFAEHLLKTYQGTNKTFLLGHWEGDWHLRPDLKVDTDRAVTPEALRGMADWLNTRQRAIDDAKRLTPHRDVRLYHYTEVNHVAIVAPSGRPSVVNRVVPETNVDYVSYSTYDSLGDIAGTIPKALDYIERKLPAKPGLAGKRVFIGEYGFAARTFSEAERDRRSRQVMRVGLQWGCPWILSWQMYNNEYKDGRENGYWLIDDRGVKQPLWHTHHGFLTRSRRHVAEFKRQHGRVPTADEFRQFALRTLEELPIAAAVGRSLSTDG